MAVTSYPTRLDTVSTDIEKVGGKNATMFKIREDQDGNRFLLLQALSEITAGQVVGAGATAQFLPNVNNTSTRIIGVNATGKTVAAGSYFWCQVYGRAESVDVEASTAALKWLGAESGTATAEGNTTYQRLGFSITAESGGKCAVFIIPYAGHATA